MLDIPNNITIIQKFEENLYESLFFNDLLLIIKFNFIEKKQIKCNKNARFSMLDKCSLTKKRIECQNGGIKREDQAKIVKNTDK